MKRIILSFFIKHPHWIEYLSWFSFITIIYKRRHTDKIEEGKELPEIYLRKPQLLTMIIMGLVSGLCTGFITILIITTQLNERYSSHTEDIKEIKNDILCLKKTVSDLVNTVTVINERQQERIKKEETKK